MAYHVEHLHSVQAVDDAINREGDSESGRLVVVRFGRGGHDDCARLDAALAAAAAEQVGPVAALYAVDTDEVRGFNDMYQLHQLPCTVMFFHGYRVVDVRSDRGRDDVDWAAYSAAAFAGLVQAVHARAKVKAGRFLFLLPCRQQVAS